VANKIQQRLLDLSVDIANTKSEDLAFTHSVLTQTSLPTSKPPDGLQVWEKQQGRARLRVEAGSVLDPKTGLYVQLARIIHEKCAIKAKSLTSFATMRTAMKSLAQAFGGLGRFRAI